MRMPLIWRAICWLLPCWLSFTAGAHAQAISPEEAKKISNEGKRYADFDAGTDRVAEYGLAGPGAVAVKVFKGRKARAAAAPAAGDTPPAA